MLHIHLIHGSLNVAHTLDSWLPQCCTHTQFMAPSPMVIDTLNSWLPHRCAHTQNEIEKDEGSDCLLICSELGGLSNILDPSISAQVHEVVEGDHLLA
jgi:hypothetical protein